jgi:hypothetical protein
MANGELNIRQERFCYLYVRNGKNGAAAAVEAGYCDGDRVAARQTASVLLTNPDILARMDEEREIWRTEISHRFLEESGHAMETLMSIMDTPGSAAIARVSAANSVLDRAGFQPVQKTELSGPRGGPIPAQIEVVFVGADPKNAG